RVNGGLAWSGDTSYITGTYLNFGTVLGIGTVDVEGDASVRADTAQWGDLPGTKVYRDYGSYYTNGYATDNDPPYNNNYVFNVQNGQTITIVASFSAMYENDIDLWDTDPRQRMAYWNNYFGHNTDVGSPNFDHPNSYQWANTSGSAHTVFLAGFHKDVPGNIWLAPIFP